jgi:nucleoside-diphosphate-sugar epimerase
MREIDRSAPVMISGATGYVAGWIVKKLLAEGLVVHCPVRNPYNLKKVEYLQALAHNAPGDIRFFKADLLDEGSYDAAMAGCQLVYHTASPFELTAKDAQRDLVDPAVNGTHNVLASANRTASVKRVVLTSSCAAIYGDNVDLQSLPGQTLNEDIWNTSSDLTHQAYSYSKTLAEKKAWAMVGEQERWDLVVINPSFVIGPAIDPHSNSESFSLITQLGDGSMKAGAPVYGIGVVDVRDLAEAQFAAGFTPAAAGRNIISGHDSSFLAMAAILHAQFGDRYPVPSRKMPKWLLWLVGPIATKGAMTRKMISRNVGYAWQADNSKSVEQLGMSYRPLRETLVDMFQQMIDYKRFAAS